MSKPSMSLVRYVLRRVIQSVPLVFFVIILAFLLIHMAPGDPIVYFTGSVGSSPEYEAMLRERFGLNKPIIEQLSIYMVRVLRGDFGYSLIFGAPVFSLILESTPASILLMASSLLFATVGGIVLGVTSARKPYSLIDNLSSLVSMVGFSLPSFWLAQMLMLVFAVYLHILPCGGFVNLKAGTGNFLDILVHLILPTVSLGMAQLAIFTRLTRANMLEELWKDYIVAARSKGLKESTVVYRHALRNALYPIISVISINIRWLIAGSVVIETVYSWPGIGRLLFDSIVKRDYPVVMGLFIFISITVIIANLVADVLHAFIDPRVRYT